MSPWRTRAWTLVAAAAVVGFLFRRPLTLATLHHETAARPAIAEEPVQAADEKRPFEHVARGKRYRIVPRFKWDESARVMSEEPYSFGAAGALIPMDWVLAWGPVVAPPYARRIHYTQVSRFYMWGTSATDLDRGTIVTHTANTHVIPATARLRRAAASVRKGDDVRLEGWLVDVDGIDDPSFHWKTSVSRSDEGPGGCETVYLTRLTVNTRAYE
ncbi:MAG TPA: hypothetical protein VKH43_00075 [Thermoanaerobaculia bacterium]|nr:hypothetical protein [Thermoanaerobaculia bacterium]